MRDQAETLRRRLETLQAPTKTIAVISGKGGVGKSNISLNFGISLSKLGKRVLLFDMDFGMGNIDILMGVTTKYSIPDLFDIDIDIEMTDLIIKSNTGIDFIAGGTGLSSLFRMDEAKSDLLIQQLQIIIDKYDYVIFDMGAGMSEDNMKFLLTVDEIFVITTPEPTSITDAYSAIKYICLFDNNIPLFLLVNRALSEADGLQTIGRLQQASKQFLKKDLLQLGILPDDRHVQKAVSHQVPFSVYAPKAGISKELEQITSKYVNQRSNKERESKSFISKLYRFMGRR